MVEADAVIAATGGGGTAVLAAGYMVKRMISRFDQRIDDLTKELDVERQRANDQHTAIELLKQQAEADKSANAADHERLQRSVDEVKATMGTRFTEIKSELQLIQDGQRKIEIAIANKGGKE